MTTHTKAIIFDFGGVLLDWNPRNLYRRYFPNSATAMEDFLAEVNFAAWNAEQDRGRPFAEGVEILSKQFPHRRQLIHAYHEHWEESIVGPIHGTVDILDQLKCKGYPLYGLSNWSGETFPIARRQYNFFESFDGIIISGEAGLIKPDPAIYKLMLDKIKRPAHDCVFIDDSLTNIEIAEKLGFSTIHFTSPSGLETDLRTMDIL